MAYKKKNPTYAEKFNENLSTLVSIANEKKDFDLLSVLAAPGDKKIDALWELYGNIAKDNQEKVGEKSKKSTVAARYNYNRAAWKKLSNWSAKEDKEKFGKMYAEMADMLAWYVSECLVDFYKED